MDIEKAELKPQFNEERLELADVLPLAAPLVIYVEISSFCNLECRFCPQHISPSEIVKKNMSLDVFEKMIDDLKQLPVRPKLMRFCGLGDSLFNKQFIEMVKVARKAEVVEKLELITNGILFRGHLIEELPKLLDRIIVSIEGLCDEDYMKYTLRKAS